MDYEQETTHETDMPFVPPPKWPKVIGVISIVLAGLGLVCGGFSAVGALMLPKIMEGPLDGDPLPPTMQFGMIDYAVMGIGTILTVVLLFAGIMLVGRRPVARPMHLVYAVCSMPLTLINMVRQFDKQGAMAQWAQDYPDNPIAQGVNQGGQGQAIGEAVGLVIGLGLGLGIPLFYFVWFAAIKTKPEQITGSEEGVY